MKRALISCFHAYTKYGTEFYVPILDFFLTQMKKFEDEYDMIYLIEDDNWKIDPAKLEGMKVKIVHVDVNLRYYEAYQEVLPQVEEDLVLFLDDDSVVYQKGIIEAIFDKIGNVLSPDVVTIIDQIGTYKTNKLSNGNKFCPYLFATPKELLMKYREVYWGSDMPEHETLGKLTEKMLDDGAKVYEFPEDKSNILFDGTKDGEHSKDTGFYHVRAGSTVAYLLAEKNYGSDKTYWDYLNNQPKQELLRHCAWYNYMGGLPDEILMDLNIDPMEWGSYLHNFEIYYGLL